MAILIGTSGANSLFGTSASDFISGLGGNDNLFGLGGNDYLDGGSGADYMDGGTGDDIYFVDNAQDKVVEAVNEGGDLVNSSISYTLTANVENLTLTGSANLSATGNGLNNRLVGNSGANTFDGKAGADEMVGGKGDDTYYVDNVDDVIDDYVDGNPSDGINDTVKTTVSFTEDMDISHGVETIILLGTANLKIVMGIFFQTLIGNSGNNWLDGGAWQDTMIGGQGDDIYFVDYTDVDNGNPYDTVIEKMGEGNADTIFLHSPGIGGFLKPYQMPDYVETLFITGNAGQVIGNAQDDLIFGSSYNDVIVGGGGIDTLKGGLGDDSYTVEVPADKVVENANSGIDTVYSYGSYALLGNIEKLFLWNSLNTNGTGNDLNNEITGGLGDNKLDGGIGADKMTGGKGNDTYVVDNAGDTVIEQANEGTDWVQSWIGHTLSANVENLLLMGINAKIGAGNGLDNVITGNTFDNTLYGFAGADTLEGGSGNDGLYGGAGVDKMTGGIGDDSYGANDVGDNIIEDALGGTDTVYATLDWSLGLNLENLVLMGFDNINAAGNADNNYLQGNVGNNILNGDLGNDTLKGDLGNDQLIGGLGADTMTGGAGDDTYEVNQSDDVIIEDSLGGTDTVLSNSTWVLGANLENLILQGAANANANGNELNNNLQGNSGNNILRGFEGADTLAGGAGNDIFVFSTTVGGADVVSDFTTGFDHLRIKDGNTELKIGDGDHVIDSPTVSNLPVTFSKQAELVIITPDIVGGIDTASAAARIGSASSAYAVGDTRLFVVDNGTDSGVFLFQSADAGAQVTANELTLVGSLQGADHTVLADYIFA